MLSLSNVIQGAASPIPSNNISFTPTGGIGAFNVHDALVELDGEKQTALVSGISIKTINGNSLMGSGDITITAGDALGPEDYGLITGSTTSFNDYGDLS